MRIKGQPEMVKVTFRNFANAPKNDGVREAKNIGAAHALQCKAFQTWMCITTHYQRVTKQYFHDRYKHFPLTVQENIICLHLIATLY
jgi:hypothetical protein